MTIEPEGEMTGNGECESINGTTARWQLVFDGEVTTGVVSGTTTVTHFSGQREELPISGTLEQDELRIEFDHVWDFSEDIRIGLEGWLIAAPVP